MPNRLILRLAADGGLTWLRAVDGRAALTVEAGAPPPAVLAGAREIVVLVPAEDVLLTEVRVSARNRAQLLQALPYAIEDQLLSPVEELHFAAAPSRADLVGAAVVSRARMDEWLGHLAAAGIQPDFLIPETLAMPHAPDTAAVVLDGTRALVRLGPWTAFACAVAELPDWLAQIAVASELRPLEIFDCRSAPKIALPVPIAAYHERQGDALALLARHVPPTPVLNLATGNYAPSHRHARTHRLWRAAAALAAAAIVLAIATQALEVYTLWRSATKLEAAVQDGVHAAFPELAPADLNRAGAADLMRARIDRLRGGAETSGLLRVLSQIAPTLGSTTRFQTRNIDYRNGVLELAVRAPDLATLDSLRERFAALPGLQVSITASNQGTAGVDGRIRIAGSAP